MARSGRLTEKQAWREIHRRIKSGKWFQCGLCAEITDLWLLGLLSSYVWRRMLGRMAYLLPRKSNTSWVWRKGQKKVRLRWIEALLKNWPKTPNKEGMMQ